MIVGVLDVQSKFKYGYTSHGTPLYLFKPLNSSLPNYIVGSNIKILSVNYLVLVEKVNEMKANLVTILGECGDWKAERKALMWMYSPVTYKKDEMKLPFEEYIFEEVFFFEDGEKPYEIDEEWTTLNIDPERCEDIDDCLSYQINNGKLRVGITIANVSNLVMEGFEVDAKAKLIGQTLYGDNERKSMLPVNFEKICSLLHKQKRMGLTLFLDYDFITQKISNMKFEEVIITNQESFTYETIYKSQHLRLIEFLEKFSGSNDSHKWIEKMMILYNKEAAKLLKSHETGIFRRHSTPRTKLELYQKYCPFIAYAAAEYCTSDKDLNHFGLSTPIYCHATSPIRRYADLVNQRCLLYILNGSKKSVDEKVITHLNLRQKLSKRYERDFFFTKVLEQNQTKEIFGVVLSSENGKTEVYVDEWKRIIRIKTDDVYRIESSVIVKYFMDSSKVNWKSRMVFQIL